MGQEKTRAATGVIVNLLFWLFFLAIIAFSLFIIHRFGSVLLGFGVLVALLLLMGLISRKVRAGMPVNDWPVPVAFVDAVRAKLGEDAFRELTALSRRCRLTDQPFFDHP